jgi:hypothetical protein
LDRAAAVEDQKVAVTRTTTASSVELLELMFEAVALNPDVYTTQSLCRCLPALQTPSAPLDCSLHHLRLPIRRRFAIVDVALVSIDSVVPFACEPPDDGQLLLRLWRAVVLLKARRKLLARRWLSCCVWPPPACLLTETQVGISTTHTIRKLKKEITHTKQAQREGGIISLARRRPSLRPRGW